MRVPTLRVNVNGTNLILRRIRDITPEMSHAQREAGRDVGNQLKREAQAIIKEFAPRTSGNLHDSIYVTSAAVNKGWNTKVTTDSPYAEKVEGGHPRETIPVTPDLLDWAERVGGDRLRSHYERRNTAIVRKGTNPRYNTGRGMQFFQTPYNKHRQTIVDRYSDEVSEILRKFR